MEYLLDALMEFLEPLFDLFKDIFCWLLNMVAYWGEVLWGLLFIEELSELFPSEAWAFVMSLLWTLNQWFPVQLLLLFAGFSLGRMVTGVTWSFVWGSVPLGGK